MRSILLLLFFTFTLSSQAQQSDFNKIDFAKADEIATRYKGEELFNLPVLVLCLTAQLETDAARFRAIYYWVTHNIAGDYHLTSQSEYRRKKLKYKPEELEQWNRQYRKKIMTTLRQDKKTLCTGYAFLIKELCTLAGLEAEIIHGYGKMNAFKMNKKDIPNHSWNAVKLDGKWYLCDATWSSGVIDMYNYIFDFSYEDSFFLMEPIEFSKTHKPLDQKWNLLDGDFRNN